MMKITELQAEEFDGFVARSNISDFTQTSSWAKVNQKRGFITHMLGFVDDDQQLKGTALLLEKKILSFSSFYCPRGFICDYLDQNVLKDIITELKRYAKQRKGLYLRIDPDLLIRRLDENGKEKEVFPQHLQLIDFLEENGATFKGFTTNFIDTSAPRFTFRVNLNKSEEDIRSAYHSTFKKILKNGNPYDLIIEKNGINAKDEFYEVMKETSLRKKMFLEPQKFFDDFYDTLHEDDRGDIYVVKADVVRLKEAFEKRVAAVNKEIEECNSRPDTPKKVNKLSDLSGKLNKALKEKEQIDQIDKDQIILSAIMTSKFAGRVWTVHGGNSDNYSFLNANLLLYDHIIFDSKDTGAKEIDFYGTEGKIDKSSPIYGIFLFKLRFGGDFDEFIGQFDFILRPFSNRILNTAISLRRKILLKQSLKKGSRT